MLTVSGGAGRAGGHFPDNLLTRSPRVVRVVLFALAGLVRAKERVGPGTKRVLLAAPPHDQALAGSPGRHDALTQLTAEHENEPRD